MMDSDNQSGAKNNGDAAAQEVASREQDRYLPIANVSRLMKKALPSNAKISKEAKVTVQQCVSEFVSFVTSEASIKCKQEKRKTITGDDLLWSMATLGFKDYAEVLKVYYQRFREMEGEKGESCSQLQRDGGNGGAAMGDNGVGSYAMMGQNMYRTQQQPYYQQQQQQQQQQRPLYCQHQHQQHEQPYYQPQQQQHQPPYYPQQQQQQQQMPHYQQQQRQPPYYPQQQQQTPHYQQQQQQQQQTPHYQQQQQKHQQQQQ